MTQTPAPPIWPKALPKGGHIRVVAPASAVDTSALAPGLEWIRAQGWRATEGSGLYDRHRYMAGSDFVRAADLNNAMSDTSIDAVISARGGYGSARLLDAIDWDLWLHRRLPVVGFSDLTALQLALYHKTGLISYSGFAPAADCKPKKPIDPLVSSSLTDLLTKHRCRPLSSMRVVKEGTADGPLLGGCLSLITTLVGTPWLPDLSGAILILEDVGEHPYRLDRMLNQLHQAGIWEQVAGVVFGQFFRCADPNNHISELIQEVADRVEGPVVANAPYGHQPSRQVIPIGAGATLSATNQGILRFDAPK